MKKRALLATLTAGTLMGGTCLSLNPDALLAQGGDILCAVATAGLPGAGHINYCSAINIDLTAGFLGTTD